jgi:hypothetical protein
VRSAARYRRSTLPFPPALSALSAARVPAAACVAVTATGAGAVSLTTSTDLADMPRAASAERLGPTRAMARATVTSTAVPMTNAMPEAVESSELILSMRGMIAKLGDHS